MFSSVENVECKVSANILLAAAQRLFSYDKIPLAMTLVQIVLDQHPRHSYALRLRELFNSESPPEADRMLHLYRDVASGMYYVGEKDTPGAVAFSTLEEAIAYLRELN